MSDAFMQEVARRAVSGLPPVVFTPSECEVFRAPLRISSYDWACRNMRIVAGRYKGQLWSPNAAPQARGILDVLDRPHVREVFYIASSQATKTTTVMAWIFAELVRRMDNVGFGRPDMDSVRRFFTKSVHPYFRAIPALRAMLLRGEESLNNFDVALKGDASLLSMWSGSDSSMRSISMPIIYLDEEDAFADDTAATRMMERADSYHMFELSKIIHTCRPEGSEEKSRIWSAAKRRAQAWMRYEARCPVCHEYQVMEHANIVPVDGSKDAGRIEAENLARYQCQHCQAQWSDAARDMAILHGRWTPEYGDPETATVVAFHFRAWESTFVKLSTVLSKWFAAQGSPRDKQAFDNNECAKPYKFVEVETSERKLAECINPLLPQGVAPEWTLALTLSVDMQKDYFLWSVAAHGTGPERMHIVDYGRCQTWEELSEVVFQSRYPVGETARSMGIWRAALDTGGSRHEQDVSRPMQAYNWLLAQRTGVIFGTKGQSRYSPGVFVKDSVIDTLPNGKKLGSPYVLKMLDTDAFKRLIFWRVDEGRTEEPLTFHAQTDSEYLKQVASERLEKERGEEKWKRLRANHYLDCLVGHHAMVHWQWKPSLAQLAQSARARDDAPPPPKPQENPYTGEVE